VSEPNPPARPVFHRLAIGVAVVCFALAAATPLAFAPGERLFPAVIFLFVGVVMSVIAATGKWPPNRP
jgi:hypothetical protein